MSTTSALHRAKLARFNYLSKLIRRKTALADPKIPGIIDQTDGTLNKDLLNDDLPVAIEEWEDVPDPARGNDYLQLHIALVDDNGVVGEFEKVGPELEFNTDNIDTLPDAVLIPKANLAPDGERQLKYSIEKYNTNVTWSNPIPYICDSIPPWGNDTPDAVSLPAVPITDAWLTANPTGIKLTLAEYDNQQAKDTYALFYSKSVPVYPDLPPALDSGLLPPNRELLIKKADIETLSDGHYYVGYVLADKATNLSRVSFISEVFVNLGTLPENLLPPKVPAAEIDGLVNLEDARAPEGVTVQIEEFANSRPSDRIEVTWGTDTDPFSEEIGSGGFPLFIRVPNEVLQKAYGKADTVVNTAVSYRVLRHGVPYGPESITVDVDFSVIGPVHPGPDPDPDWPDPINSQLLAPTVKGEVSDTANELHRSDANRPAKLSFPLYTPAVDGEVVDFYWDGTLVTEATYDVKTADGPTITVNIPWSYIVTAGNNPALPVFYTIRKSRAPGNEQRSVSASVNVDAVTVVPEAAEFQRTTRDWLNCNSLWEDPLNPAGDPAFRVFVKPLAQHLPNGGVVTMNWTALGGLTGENPISGAELTVPVTITKQQAEDGFYWDIKPYVTHILPIYQPAGDGADGRGRVTYSFKIGAETVTSEPVENKVGLGTGAGTCPIPAP
ncbi:hypothetical protein ABI582_12925 [Pseudomonas sp. SAS7]|uniref:hypothetical protein n=1 Tax=Pseudomonas sp. SAS7 TaxID=3156487 RepID=UPI003F95A6AD